MTSSGTEVYTQHSAKEQKQGSACRKAVGGYNREEQHLNKHANQLQDGGPHLQSIPAKLVTQTTVPGMSHNPNLTVQGGDRAEHVRMSGTVKGRSHFLQTSPASHTA